MGPSSTTHRYNSSHPASRSVWERLNVVWYDTQLLHDRTTGLWSRHHMPRAANGTVIPRVPYFLAAQCFLTSIKHCG